MKLKRIFSLILVCSLLFTITACSKDKKPSGNSSTENVNSSDNGILSQLPVGGDETSSEKFDNTIGTDISTPKPGYDYSDTITNKPATVPESTKEESSYKLSELLQPVENDSDKVEFKSDLQYLYEGVNYVYGITAEGREIIAYKDVKGNIIDNMEGAGNFNIKSNQGLEILTAGSIKSITPSMSGSNFILTVTYEPEGINAAESSIKIVYVFRDYSIGVTAQVITSGNYYISPKNSFFKRRFLNGVSDKSWRAVDKWTYPQNGDYPYQETDSACMITELDDTHQTYTFVRGENLPDLLFKESYETGDPVLTNIENNKKGLNYTFNCDIVLASKKDADEDTDYMALFAGRGGDFAVGISPLKPEKDNSTIFVGDEVSLNLNVMNLSTETVKFSLRYDIRDYYGNIVDAGLFINSSVFKNQEANRNITIKPEKKGIFYLNLYAVSKYYKYQECYPFALLPEHTYKYNATSPFGMSTNESNIEYAYLSAKIGIANQRVNTQHIQMAKNLYEQGITRINGQAHMKNWPIKGDEKVPTIEACKQNLEIFKMEFTNHLKNLPKYFDSVEIGNELNNWTMSSDTYTPEEFNSRYIPYTVLPAIEIAHNLGYKISPLGLSTGDSKQTEKFYEYGIWDKFDILSYHPYGFPQMPDEFNDNKSWVFESHVKAIVDSQKKYGEKETYITETGAATVPGVTTGLDLRTHADYNTRMITMGMASGASRIQMYSLIDTMSYTDGWDIDNSENNFGILYSEDYYGVIKPKPAAVAFAQWSRKLESVIPIEKDYNAVDNFRPDCFVNTKYDGDNKTNTVRAFTINTKEHGSVIVAWSNANPLPNAINGQWSSRVPTLPWKNQWQKSEKVTFEATEPIITVTDIMGNDTTYKASNGKVTIPLTGSPVIIKGVK